MASKGDAMLKSVDFQCRDEVALDRLIHVFLEDLCEYKTDGESAMVYKEDDTAGRINKYPRGISCTSIDEQNEHLATVNLLSLCPSLKE